LKNNESKRGSRSVTRITEWWLDKEMLAGALSQRKEVGGCMRIKKGGAFICRSRWFAMSGIAYQEVGGLVCGSR